MYQRLKELGAEPWHLRRYEETWRAIEPFRHAKLLDVGGESAFTAWLREQGCNVASTGDHDVREPWPFADGAFDLVLIMEVLEHLRDREDSPRCTWTESGQLACLREARRVGARLFLSTPNVTSLRNVDNVLRGHHPFMFPPHVREMTPNDVRRLLGEAGWERVPLWTADVWDRGGMSDRRATEVWRACKVKRDRGDVIFVLAE